VAGISSTNVNVNFNGNFPPELTLRQFRLGQEMRGIRGQIGFPQISDLRWVNLSWRLDRVGDGEVNREVSQLWVR